MGPTIAPESDMEADAVAVVPDTFRHVAFLAAILLLLGAWKFGLEGILE